MNFIVKDFESLLSHFKLEGEIKGITPLGSGLINDTYCVETVSPDTPNYVLQRINHAVFQDVELLQNNIWLVTNHIKKKLKEIETKQNKLEAIHQKQVEELERISGLSTEDAKNMLIDNIKREAEQEAAIAVKEIERESKETAERKAREIITYAI